MAGLEESGITEPLHALHPAPGREGSWAGSPSCLQPLGDIAGSVTPGPHLPLWEEWDLEHTSPAPRCLSPPHPPACSLCPCLSFSGSAHFSVPCLFLVSVFLPDFLVSQGLKHAPSRPTFLYSLSPPGFSL